MFGGVLEKQPLGIFVLTVLNLFFGLASLFFGYVGFVLNGISTDIMSVIIPGAVITIGGGFLLLVDSVLIYLGTRAGYFLSIVLWVLFLAADVWWIYSTRFIGPTHIMVLMYCAVSLTYFSTHYVRKYFGL